MFVLKVSGPYHESSVLIACVSILLQMHSYKRRLDALNLTRPWSKTLPGGRGGGTFSFSSYEGLDPASTVQTKKYQEYQAYPRQYLKFL